MKKSILLTGILALAMGITSLSAKEFDLKTNMLKLNNELNAIERGFISGDANYINASLDIFAKDADDLLAHKKHMMKQLPANMKNKNHKATKGRDAARKIRHSVKTIREALSHKDGLSGQKSRAKAQAAYLDIVNACFKCHNVVRDKKRLSVK